MKTEKKQKLEQLRRWRIRKKVTGTKLRPRMAVCFSCENIHVQFIAECDFVAWGKPLPEKCPECGSAYLIEKFLKAGPVAQCPNGECKFKKPLPPVEAAPVEAPVAV